MLSFLVTCRSWHLDKIHTKCLYLIILTLSSKCKEYCYSVNLLRHRKEECPTDSCSGLRGSYTRDHFIWNLWNEPLASFINFIWSDHECKILFIIWTLSPLKLTIVQQKMHGWHGRRHDVTCSRQSVMQRVVIFITTVSILRKSISCRHRPVRVADGPMTARCRFT